MSDWDRGQIGGRRGWISLTLLAIGSCSGCWEEIHYTPSAATPQESAEPTDVAEATPAGSASHGAAASEELVAPLPPETPVLPPPLQSDLFGGDDDHDATTTTAQDPVIAEPAEPATDEEDAAPILPTPSAAEEPGGALADGDWTTDPARAESPTPAERRLAWQAVSKWSLAAAIHAKGLPSSPETAILDEASQAAAELGITLPELPTVPRQDDLQAAVIEGLRGELAVAARNAYANRWGEAEAATAELAIRSQLLLLTYSPRSADGALEAEGLRRAGEGSGLPSELWTPLVTLVEERAPFLEVRQGVFDLHRRVEAHLGSVADGASD